MIFKSKPKPNRDINFLDLYRIVSYVHEHRLRKLKNTDEQAPIASGRWEDFYPTLSMEQDFEYAYRKEDGSYELNFDSYIERLKVRIEREGLGGNITVEENPGKIFFRESGRAYYPQYKITVKDLRVKCFSYRDLYFDNLDSPSRFFPRDSRRIKNKYNGSIYIEFKENIFQSATEHDHISTLWFNLDCGIYAIFRSNVFERVSLSLAQRSGRVFTASFCRMEKNIFKDGFAQVFTGDTYDSYNSKGEFWPTPHGSCGFHTKFESLAKQHATSILQDSMDRTYRDGVRLRHEQIQEWGKCRKDIAKIATSMYPWSEHDPIRITPDDIESTEQNNNVIKILSNEFDHLLLYGSGAIVLVKNKINKFTIEASNIHFADAQKIEYMYDYKSVLGDLKKRAIEIEDRQERKILEEQIYKIEYKNMEEGGYVSWWQRRQFQFGFYNARFREHILLIFSATAAIASVISLIWNLW